MTFSINGTMTGLLSEVSQGLVDTSIAGFVVTEARDRFVSFSPGIYKTANRAFIRKPQDTDFSFFYHIGQFLPGTWISLMTFYSICFLTIFISLLYFLSPRKALSNSFQIVSKAVISMGNTVKKSNASFKMGSFAILISCMLIFIHYRAQMNAALNAKITTLPVTSWEEIYASQTQVLISTGGVAESYFKRAPKGSIRRKIYDEIISQIKSDDHLNGKGAVLRGKDAIMKGNSIVFYNEESFTTMPEFPCLFTDIKELKHLTNLALPFHQDSPIKDIFNEVLLELNIHGTIERIWDQYQDLDKQEICEEPVVSTQTMLINSMTLSNLLFSIFQTGLSYEQLMLPIIVLLCGTCLSCVLVVLETFKAFNKV